MTVFSLGGSIFGMAEETIPFVIIFIPLARRLGYDSIVGVSIPFLGSVAGFSAAFSTRSRSASRRALPACRSTRGSGTACSRR